MFYETSDGDLAAYLSSIGIRHSHATIIDDKYVLFQFPKTSTIEQEVQKFYSDSAVINPRLYAEQLRKVRILFHTLRRNTKGVRSDAR